MSHADKNLAVSFVRNILHDRDDAATAQAIIAMAHNLGIRLIAESVETAEQIDFLRARQCDGLQGCYPETVMGLILLSLLFLVGGNARRSRPRYPRL